MSMRYELMGDDIATLMSVFLAWQKPTSSAIPWAVALPCELPSSIRSWCAKLVVV